MLLLEPRQGHLSLHLRTAVVALLLSVSEGVQTGINSSTLLYNSSDIVSSKRGTGWGFNATDLTAELQALPVSWWYNWGNYNPDAKAAAMSKVLGMSFSPMIWGWCCGLNELPDGLPEEATELLGFNEPNHMEESNLSPAAAAQLWPKLEAAAEKLGLRLGSPAAAPCGAYCVTSSPFEWWDQFFGNCTGCRVDFMAAHLYTCSPQYLQWFINDLVARYKKPVWLTEFACPNEGGPLKRQITYMRSALKLLDEEDAVERYAWFSPHADAFAWIGPTASLLRPNVTHPALTPLGQIYLSGGCDGRAVAEAMRASDGAASLSEEDIQALMAPLPLISSVGSWVEACRNCTAAADAAFVAGRSIGGAKLEGEFLQHCLDCGLIQKPPTQRLLSTKS